MYKNKCLIIFFLMISCLTKGSAFLVKSEDSFDSSSQLKSSTARQETDLVSFFYKPIDFSQNGMSYYFKYVYNHPEYVRYLPYNLSHMIQFLEYGTKAEQSEAFAASVVKLFMQKIKATPYVDAESFVEFLPKFAVAIKPYLEKKESTFLKEMQSVLKDRLTSVFSKYFSYFQKNPDGFMDALAEQIAKQTHHQSTLQHVEIEQLKKDILRFVELCANKLVWSSKDDLQVWYVCNKIAQEGQQCLNQQILSNQEAQDDFCWSLVHRFCYFVELAAPTLSKEFYDQVLLDLQSKPLVLTSIEEQEDSIKSKRDHLAECVQMYREQVYPKTVSNIDLQFDESKFKELAKQYA